MSFSEQAGFVVYEIWNRQRMYEASHPSKPQTITVGVDLPTRIKKVKGA